MSDRESSGENFGLSLDPPVVREHLDGTWSVHYPEEGRIQTKPGQSWPLTDSYWPGASGDDPRDFAAAVLHARAITDQDPKIERLTEGGLKRKSTLQRKNLP